MRLTLLGARRSASASCLAFQPLSCIKVEKALASSIGWRSSRRQFSMSCCSKTSDLESSPSWK